MPTTYEGIVTASETIKDIKLEFVRKAVIREGKRRGKTKHSNRSRKIDCVCASMVI